MEGWLGEGRRREDFDIFSSTPQSIKNEDKSQFGGFCHKHINLEDLYKTVQILSDFNILSDI